MRRILLLMLLAAPLAMTPRIGSAKGCIKGAVVGGVIGHYAGRHAVVGAVAGCVIEHHREKTRDRDRAHAPGAAAAEPANRPEASRGGDDYRQLERDRPPVPLT